MSMRRLWKHWTKNWKVYPESLPYYTLLRIQLIRVWGSATEYLLKVNNKNIQTSHSTLTCFQYSYHRYWWNTHVKQFILVKFYDWRILRKKIRAKSRQLFCRKLPVSDSAYLKQMWIEFDENKINWFLTEKRQ